MSHLLWLLKVEFVVKISCAKIELLSERWCLLIMKTRVQNTYMSMLMSTTSDISLLLCLYILLTATFSKFQRFSIFLPIYEADICSIKTANLKHLLRYFVSKIITIMKSPNGIPLDCKL